MNSNQHNVHVRSNTFILYYKILNIPVVFRLTIPVTAQTETHACVVNQSGKLAWGILSGEYFTLVSGFSLKTFVSMCLLCFEYLHFNET